MKRRHQAAIVLAAVTAKCRGLWEGLTCSGAVARSADDYDYFRWSYEFSCTATPVVKGRDRLCRRLPPCAGGRRSGSSPEDGVGHEIDRLAGEFISGFHEQLRLQRVAELHGEREKTSRSPSVRRAPVLV